MFLELLVCGALLFVLYKIYNRPQKLNLPGPRGKPILGNLLQLDPKTPHLRLSEWNEKYGAVYTIRLMSDNWVVVGDYDYIYKVLVKEGMEFAGRATNIFRMSYATRGRQDIFQQLPTENFWSVGRKTLHRNIKQYSSGMEHIEEVINKMTSKFIKKQMAFQGQPRDPTDDIYNYTLSNLLHLALGWDLDENNELFAMAKKMERTAIVSQSMTGRGTELDMFPWLRFFGNWAYRKITEGIEMQDAIWARVKPLLLEQLNEENPGCVMEALIVAERNQHKVKKEGQLLFGDINVALALGDILVAGLTTSSHTIMSLLVVLLHHPDIMRRLQKEVDEVVGADRQISIIDRDAMPYTRAVVYETLRYSSIVPLGVPHAAMKDTQLGGAHIPKGTIILTNLWQLHHDEKFWDAPFEFKPERFLDEAGQLLPPDHPNRKHLMPFGAGTRVCVGEIFALTRLFMFTASLMQNFDVLPDPESELPSCDPRKYDVGIVLCPVVGRIRLVPRTC